MKVFAAFVISFGVVFSIFARDSDRDYTRSPIIGASPTISYFSGTADSHYIKNPYVDGFGYIQVKEVDNYRKKEYYGLSVWYNIFRHWESTKDVPIVFAFTIGVNETSGSNSSSFLYAGGLGFLFGEEDSYLFSVQWGAVRERVETLMYPYNQNAKYPGGLAREDGSPEAFISNALLNVPTEAHYGTFSGINVSISKSLSSFVKSGPNYSESN
ncbi:hypothetical protein AB3N61_05480 [Leptospira sp. WS58.C1]|uniref:hypothetical protein n=1 Tax=Leptospira TaxID=171 RepID=UPI0002BE3C7A|nr:MULTISPECIES: hypothetical protein [unclassified Leptospira]EMJ97496.1 hypothetical protein LEP1GSC192_3627 [Leptospira sp. B5-022]MCR1795428.1 hypothetical protein [Leptospira sp. id769339]